jgi:hypothetical protein
LRYANVEPASPVSQIINPLAKGAATRWHGYAAREGFGITRIRNQTSENNPAIGNNQTSQWNLLLYISSFGQDGLCFLFSECILTPPLQ